MKKSILFALLALGSLASAQTMQTTISLVKNINENGDGNPQSGVEYNGKLYFAAGENVHGTELWVTDGTEAGTALVKDIYPGNYSSAPSNLTVYNDKLYFSATDGTHGYEVWVTDGTASGTHIVKDISTSGDSHPAFFTIFNNKLFFVATDNIHGFEVWSTDGTAEGTTMLKDINEGSEQSNPGNLTVANGKLFFSADDGTNGIEPWVTDGTTGGTMMLKDINPSTTYPDSFPANFAVYNNKLIFTAYNETEGDEPYISDGTAAGTKLLKNINAGSADSYAAGFTEYNGKLYFSAFTNAKGNELWVTDGTTSGTKIFKNLSTGSYDSDPEEFAVYNGKLYFSAYDDDKGQELWVSDGTPEGTNLFVDINPNDVPYESSNPYGFTELNGKLYFIADNGEGGNENYDLWVTDGTVEGTKNVKPADATRPNPLRTTDSFVVYNDALYFKAEYTEVNPGLELYKLTEDIDLGTNSSKVFETKVFPNPVGDLLNIKSNTRIESVSIYNVEGRNVISNAKVSGGKLNVSTLEKGIYLLQINYGNNKTETVKIIKK